MTTTATRQRILIPARKSAPAERLLTVKPWFLRTAGERAFVHASGGETHAPPQILTFTTDDFIEAFFAGVADASGGSGMETLDAFRDWSEPPRAMVDLHGNPRYPATVERHAPVLDVRLYAGEDTKKIEDLDGDDIPHGEPPWLRKLYLGLHRHHQIVTTEVVCRRFDAPPLSADRILGSGMILRRLVPDATSERWEDWIPGAKDGLWREIADASMVPLTGGESATPGAARDEWFALDPESIPAEVFGDTAERSGLFLRLGHSMADLPVGGDAAETQAALDARLPAALPSVGLSPIPAAHGEAGAHTAFFGYLPLASPDLSLPEPRPDDVASLKELLEARTRSHLAREWFGLDLSDSSAAIDLASEPAAVAHYEDKLDRVEDLLDALVNATLRPDAVDDTDDRSDIGLFVDTSLPASGRASRPSDWEARLDLALDTALDQALDDWWDHVETRTSIDDANTWWRDSGVLSLARQRLEALSLDAWLELAITAAAGTSLDRLLTARMRQAVHALHGGSGTQAFRGDGLKKAHALLLLRVRAYRRRLAEDIYEDVYPDPADRPDLADEREVVKEDGSGGSESVDVPVLTVSSLTDEIDAWLAAEDQRDQWPRPWEPHVPITRLKAVHDDCAELERIYADLYERSAGAGSAFPEHVATEITSAHSGAGLDRLFDPRLCEAGLDVNEQPLLGLLVFPRVNATAAQAVDFAEEVVAVIAGAPDEDIQAERHALHKIVQPRFDADSLYAVWCWVRVKAQDPCERDHLLWTSRGDTFSLAEPTDLLGARPVAFALPDLKKMVRDLPRIAKAGANPFAAVTTPPDSGVSTGEAMTDTARSWGIGWVCSFGIPVFTICAWILFMIILSILLMIPGFGWLLLLKFCIPVPTKE